MNPPFASTNRDSKPGRNGIPAFAGLNTPIDEQYAMARKLKKISTGRHGNAGIAANFLEVAHAKVKHGGVLAMILPFTFVNGSSWKYARDLIETYYHDIIIVSIANSDLHGTAFSSDTGMAEIQLIATRSKTVNKEAPTVTYVNLTARPRSVPFARCLSEQITQLDAPSQARLKYKGNTRELSLAQKGCMLSPG